MIPEEQLKKISNLDLNEALDKKLDILELCIDGVLSAHEGCTALYWAFEDVQCLIGEVRDRLDKMPE
ncbi:hypothetical protein ACG2F4_07180 [Halalkalibaculum sp. DA3122]|uniref:hypothetical protein n=1 Tax=Halalkalibaculum sp. DA3122 TaxID=3373607 RepID=UPI003754A2DD